ncbi:MAG: T9SS type A sorting domain-containing protein [Bacteroidetes bacterium SB0662_bin_6]|nr:T9SS type A sorting domain-containing protein [Bacteroidetes bacterium SB0668_bin_1]MYE03421.1 T9SS type A sorting domain-containing protein [Bacteroidetes bacterium SB0662_bin_6]
MTFLLQKFNAINRTRTETRARSGLRSPASGIAFTGRLVVVCLLLAGFLGVGSAVAQTAQQQPIILRVGGGSATLSLTSEGASSATGVHHYVLNDGDGVTPSSHTNFVAGTHAHVVVNSDNLTVTPLSAGKVKLALAPNPDQDLTTGADGTNNGTPIEFEIMSSGSPYLMGTSDDNDATGYNEEVTAPHVHSTVMLTVRDKPSMQIKDIDDLFNDPNDITLAYSVKADPVKKAKNWKAVEADGASPSSDMIDVAVVTATLSGTTLTIALTGDARADDATKVWLIATDSRGEYARLQIDLGAVEAAQNYYVNDNKEDDKIYRENDTSTTADLSEINLANGFSMGENTQAVYYSVVAKADNSAYVTDANDASYTIVAPALVASVTQTGDDPDAPGPTATFDITDIRSTGKVEVTVSATNQYKCADGFDGTPVSFVADACTQDKNDDGDTNDEGESIASEPDYSMGASYSFTITVITKTTPKPTDNDIEEVELVADGDPEMVNLADLDADKADAQAAFEDATEGGLTYTVELDKPIAMASVDGSVITFAPVWHGEKDAKTAKATVTAENNLGETFHREIDVKVTHAIAPIVSEAVQAALATGFTLTLNTGDPAMTVNLANVMIPNPADATMPLVLGPVFMNPYPDHGTLPGGLLYVLGVEADFKSPASTANNVITSAMIVNLDPQAAMLKVTPLGANSAVVTLTATNRANKSASVTIPVMVVSGVSAEDAELPTEVELSQNYPNPFNPQTTIDYALPQAGDVSLVVYDMLGREVDVLMDGPQAAGRHTVRFGANHLPNGTYVYRLIAGDKTITRTMVLVK